MKSGTKSFLTRVLISLIFILNGISYSVPAINGFSGRKEDFVAVAFGVTMFVLGIMGLFRVQVKACRVMSVIVCAFAVYQIVVIILGGTLLSTAMIPYLTLALLSWLYFDCQ